MVPVLKPALAVALAVWALTGCASESRQDDSTTKKFIESFDGEPVVPRGANRLYIAPPVNSTDERDLAERLLIKVRQGVSLDGRLGVDSDDTHADLRLEIRVTKYLVEKLAYDAIGRAVKKRLWITADARLNDLKRKKTIFLEKDIQAFRVFSDLVMPIEPGSLVIERVLDELALRIATKTVTGWYTNLLTDIEQRKK
jgi:hypothetical protein